MRMVYVTLYHEMSHTVPDSHFQVLMYSESKFYAITMVKIIFRSED